MKSIKYLLFVATLLLCLSCGDSQNQINNDMKKLTFNTQQTKTMAVIACHEARGDLSSLAVALNNGFNEGLTVNQLKEAFSQLYAYTGFPRSLNALGTLQKVVEQRKCEGLATIEGVAPSSLPSNFNALKSGTKVQTELVGQPFSYDFCPSEDYYLKAHLFGAIFANDALSYADRELVTVSALCGLEGVMPQLLAHVRGAINMGVPEEVLRSLPEVMLSAGLRAESGRCAAALSEVLDGQHVVASQSSWALGDSNDAYAQYFKGQSYLAVLDESGLCNVSFEPGCRNNWHIHHGAVQVLVCVSGRGWYQEWGKSPVELLPGVVIAVPEGVKHWHGAAADSWMQHLTYHTNVKTGNSTEWLEEVSDEVYNSIN